MVGGRGRERPGWRSDRHGSMDWQCRSGCWQEPPTVPDSRAVPKKQTRLSLVWTIPIIAALVGVWVAVARIRSEGPKITIVFQLAEGLEETPISVKVKHPEIEHTVRRATARI